MNRVRVIGVLIFCVWGLLLHAQTISNRIVATVGNEPITLLDVKQQWLLTVLESEGVFLSLTPTNEKLRAVLNGIIEDHLLVKYAEQKNLAVNEQIVDENVQRKWDRILRKINSHKELSDLLEELGLTEEQLKELYREREKNDQLIAQVMVPRLSVTQKEIEEYTRQLKEKKKPLITYRLSQIYLTFTPDTRESVIKKAYSLLEELSGGASFAELAKQYSQDPSKANGGDLGYLDAGQFDPRVEDAIKNQPVGKVCGPIVDEHSVRIVKVTDKITPRDRIFRKKYYTLKKSLIDKLRKKTNIKIFL
ncbi:peptidylprolyl isomerase [Candidatus Sumerlaeota bacterium]|nr:peptidylprolyl isomerase [Candidatus Sumerlaeota bacterium]